MLAFDILSVPNFHNVVRLPFYLCRPFAQKDQVEFIPVMKVKRNHMTGRHFVDVRNHLFVRYTGQIYLAW